MKYEIDDMVAFRLKAHSDPQRIFYGDVVDIVGKGYIIENSRGKFQVTEGEVVTVMDPGVG
jgi:hypothetical protein